MSILCDASQHGATGGAATTLRVLPIDPIDRVTGSCYLVHEPKRDMRILVDCGAYQDGENAGQLDDAPFPFDPARIHTVLLTHGHYDHCGRLPKLVRDGFTGEVIATAETIAIAKIVLEDSLKHGNRGALADAIRRIRWREVGQHLFVCPLPIAPDVFVLALRSSHILGAVSWEIIAGPKERTADQARVLFSGDIGNNRHGLEVQPLLGRAMNPTATADLALVESTYGGTRRSPAALDPRARRQVLAREIWDGLARGGPILIPVFGIQRAQDVMWDLHLLAAQEPGLLDGIPILVDAPMALRFHPVLRDGLTRSFISPGGRVRTSWLSKHSVRELGLDPDVPEQMEQAIHVIRRLFDEAPVWFPGASAPNVTEGAADMVRFRPRWSRVDSGLRAATVAEERPRIVIATSGTADGGPIQSWLVRWLVDARASVLFSGFCGRGTLGAKLLTIGGLAPDERHRLQEPLVIGGGEVRPCDMAARVVALTGYSAHADQDGLVDWVFPVKDDIRFPVARRVLITHGEASPRRQLRDAIQEFAKVEGFEVDVLLPQPQGDAIDARTGARAPRDEVLGVSVITAGQPGMQDLLRELAELKAQNQRLLAQLADTGASEAERS